MPVNIDYATFKQSDCLFMNTLFIFHIILFVCDGLSSVGFTTYQIGVKSRGVGNGVKHSKRVRTYAPLHVCACTGVRAPAHTRCTV